MMPNSIRELTELLSLKSLQRFYSKSQGYIGNTL